MLSLSCLLFSRMRSRRVAVLRLGSRGPGGDVRSLRLCPPSVRKRLQASASVGECRASSGIANRRETQNCRHFLRFSVPKVSTVTGIGRGVVAKRRCRRTVVTFGLVSGLRVSKVSTVTEIGGGVVAKRRCRRTVVTFGLVSGLRASKVSTVTGIRVVVVVAKRRTFVTLALPPERERGEERGERRKER